MSVIGSPSTIRWIIAATLSTMLIPCGARGGADAGTVPRLRTCALERDDAARLECFDRVVAGIKKDTVSLPAAAAVPEEQFGVRGGQLAQQRAEEQMEPESVIAKVSSIGRNSDGGLQLILDNGQVWSEKQSNPRFRVQAGDSITLKRGALNSYRMVTSSGRSTRVTRVQ